MSRPITMALLGALALGATALAEPAAALPVAGLNAATASMDVEQVRFYRHGGFRGRGFGFHRGFGYGRPYGYRRRAPIRRLLRRVL